MNIYEYIAIESTQDMLYNVSMRMFYDNDNNAEINNNSYQPNTIGEQNYEQFLCR